MPGAETGFPQTLATTLRRLDDPKRSFWLVVGLITLGGAILRLQIHDFALPWFDLTDELELWYYGRHLRDLPLPYGKEIVYTGPYPPLILWLHQLAQPLAEAQGRLQAADAVLDLRRLVLVFSVSGTVWFAMLGRRCGGAPAGVIAAAIWAFEPRLLGETVYAIAESLIFPLQVLAILLAVHALEAPRRPWLALVSMALGLLCFLGDYRWLVATFPGAGALLWLAWRRFRPAWHRALLCGVAGLALAAGGGVLLFARLPAGFQTIAGETLTTHLWDFETLFRWLGKCLSLVHPAFLLLFLSLVLLTLRSRQAPRTAPPSTPALLMTGATMILVMWAVTAIRAYGDASLGKIWLRYQLSTLLMLYLLLATAVAQLLPRVQGPRLRNLLLALFAAGLLLFHLLPSLQLVQEYRVPPWPLVVRRWADDNLESSNILIYPASFRWFEPARSGIPHRVWFNPMRVTDIRDHSLDALIETRGISWALIPLREHLALQESEAGRAMLEQMLPVRAFTAPPFRRYDETILYRLWRMQRETDLRFGEHIRLVGYDLHSPDPQPGEQLDLTLYWNASSTPPENYSFFLHLVADDDPRPLAQVDGNPAVPARLTQTWDQPDEILISPRISLTLPQDLAPGDYRVRLGLYNFESGARLPVRDASGTLLGDALELLLFRISGS